MLHFVYKIIFYLKEGEKKGKKDNFPQKMTFSKNKGQSSK